MCNRDSSHKLCFYLCVCVCSGLAFVQEKEAEPSKTLPEPNTGFTLEDFAVDDLVFAWYKDGHYYRAQVKAKNLRKKTLTIRFDDVSDNTPNYPPHLLCFDEEDMEIND